MLRLFDFLFFFFIGLLSLFSLPSMFSLRSDFYSRLLTFYNLILPTNRELKARRRKNYIDTDYTLSRTVLNIL